MLLIIEGIERFGWEHAFSCYWFLDDIPHTEATVEWLLNQVEQEEPGTEDELERVEMLLSSLTHAPPTLLQKHKTRFFAIPWVDSWSRNAIKERVRIAAPLPLRPRERALRRSAGTAPADSTCRTGEPVRSCSWGPHLPSCPRQEPVFMVDYLSFRLSASGRGAKSPPPAARGSGPAALLLCWQAVTSRSTLSATGAAE